MTAALVPLPGESLIGFLRRLAASEAYDDLRDFLMARGLAYGRPMIENIGDAELVLDVPPGTLAAIAPAANAATPVLEWRYQRNHCAAVCPLCIAEGRPHQQSWRHRFVLACTAHEVRLVGTCPLCSETLDTNRGSSTSCACGCPLEKIPVQPAAPWEVAISALISGVVHPSRALLPPGLAFRTPRDIGRFLYFLAVSSARSRTGKPGKTPLPRTPEESQEFLSGLEALLCNWPDGFEQDVSERLQLSDAPTVPERLGKFHDGLMSFKAEAYADFRSAVGRIATKVFEGPYLGKGPAIGPRGWISAAEAARNLGIRADRIVEAVSNGAIAGKIHGSGFGHRNTMIPRASIDLVQADRLRFIDKSSARILLGISKAQYRLLDEAGALDDVISRDPPPLVSGAIDRDAVLAMVRNIAGCATECDDAVIPFRGLNLRFTTDKARLLEILGRIMRAEIAPTRASVAGALGDFEFPVEAIVSSLDDRRNRQGLTIEEVAEIGGWKPQCVAHWCDIGLMSHVPRDHFRGVMRIVLPAQLAAFQSEYVAVSILARQLGTSSRALFARFALCDIKTVGWLQDGVTSRGHLVRIADLTRVAAALSANTCDPSGAARPEVPR